MHSGACRARHAPERSCRGLALRLSASCLLDLLFVRAAGGGPLGLGGGLFTGGALYFLAFYFVFNLGGVCHGFLFRCESNLAGYPVDMPFYGNSPLRAAEAAAGAGLSGWHGVQARS